MVSELGMISMTWRAAIEGDVGIVSELLLKTDLPHCPEQEK